MLEVGSVIAGKLRIDRILGEGGMGVVAAATHLQLEQRVAIKVMREQLVGDTSTVERFMREARSAAQLRSEHVCRVTDVGQLPSGAPYIVMELLEGTDLAALVARTPLPLQTAADHVLQACIAIAEAHAHGIVHRDLKPANLFLTKRLGGAPLIKVLDFGIAKAPSKGEVALTQTESMMGSPGYMSPEQFRSARDVDARTDIWALGVILYQLVSARVPFPATSVTELAVKVAMDPPEPLEVDAAFRAVVMRCLEKAASDRFPTVAELAVALAPFGSESAQRSLAVIEQLSPRASDDALLGTQPATAVDPMARTAATSTPKLQSSTTLQGAAGYTQEPASPTRPRRNRMWIGIALAIIGAAGATALALSWRGTPSGVPPLGALGGRPTNGVASAAPAEPELPTGSAGPATPASGVESAAVPAVQASAVGSARTPARTPSAVPSRPPSSPSGSPPSTSSATTLEPKVVNELKARFATAIKNERCDEAGGIAKKLNDNDVPFGASELGACWEKRQNALNHPSSPAATRTNLVRAEELLEFKQYVPARSVIDAMLYAGQDTEAVRALGTRIACTEGVAAEARRYFASMPSGKLRDEVAAFCKDRGVSLSAPAQ